MNIKIDCILYKYQFLPLMSDDNYNGRQSLGSVYPVGAVGDGSGWQESGPLITAQDVREQYLWGIPLVSLFPDPVTQKRTPMSDALITKLIERAVALIELKGFVIMEKFYEVKAEWDYLLFQRNMFTKVPGPRPINRIKEFGIRLADDQLLFQFPNEWIDRDKLATGQISLTPIGIGQFGSGYQGVNNNGIGGGIWYLGNGLSGVGWAPSYYSIAFYAGFPNGQIPKIFNEAIGLQTAILVLQQLAAARAFVTSQSLSLDGMSQSVGTPGPMVFKEALGMLQIQYDKVINRLKSIYQLTNFSSDVG